MILFIKYVYLRFSCHSFFNLKVYLGASKLHSKFCSRSHGERFKVDPNSRGNGFRDGHAGRETLPGRAHYGDLRGHK